MFKFAKFFFIVFLITTVMPLLFMFIWNHNQLERIRLEKDQHFLEFGLERLQLTTKQYLEIRESFILRKMQNLPHRKLSLKKLRNVFETSYIEWIYNKNIDKIKSYYSVIKFNPREKPQLCTISEVPFKISKISGIRIAQKVDLNKLHPPGPFDLKIYAGNKIDEDSLLGIVY